MAISYQITPEAEKHLFTVELTFVAIAASQELALPVWIPGSYMVREFSKNILRLTATQGNAKVGSSQTTKNSWLLSGLEVGRQVQVYYAVYAYEYGIRSAFLDHSRGYFNPTSLCLTLVGSESANHKISFKDLAPNWQVASGLAQQNGSYLAQDYNELLDSPFELGTFERLEFLLAGVRHYLVLSGSIPPYDRERILVDMSKICAYQLKLFGGVAPYADYTFILNLSGEVYTGLEHRNSSLLMAPYYALPNLNGSNDDDYLKLLGLISHEFFHTWNVKRIKPKIFTPYDLYQENYTKLLWWFEGVTSYYDDLVLYRSGVIDQSKYLALIVANLNNVYKFAGVTQQSVANSSLTAWVKYYRQDENSPNSIVSYYVKGALIAMCLDLQIRDQSQFSLDDVMLYLYNQWQANLLGVGENEIPALIKAATGVDLTSFIQLASETTDMLPFNELFSKFGLNLSSSLAKNHQDSGKVLSPAANDAGNSLTSSPLCLDLGAKLEKQALGYSVKNVYLATPAAACGLAAGDLILAINGLKLSNLEKQLAFFGTGEAIRLSIFRNERLLEFKLILAECSATLYNLSINDAELLNNWL